MIALLDVLSRTRPALRLFSVASLAVLAAETPCRAGGTHFEDFSANALEDQANTTADWNVGAGELRLHPFAPTQIGSWDSPASAWSVVVAGDLAYLGDFSGGLQILDITDPGNPIPVGSYDTPGQVLDLQVTGNLAYLADDGQGIRILDVTDPSNPTLLGSINPPGNSRRIDLSGDHLYVGSSGSGLQVVDVTDPANPTVAGALATPGTACGVCVSGDLVYLASQGAGVHVIDVTDPTNPVLLATFDTESSAYDVVVAGDHAYVADLDAGLLVLDVSDPSNPVDIGTHDTPGQAFRLFVAGDRAYLADGAWGLQVFDISDPTTPTLAHNHDTPLNARGIFVAGDHAYLADDATGLLVVDIGDPVPPTPVGQVTSTGYFDGFSVAGNLAFVAAGAAGLHIIDISDPATPVQIGSYDTADIAMDVAVAGDHAFVADGGFLQAIDISDPASPSLDGTLNLSSRRITISGDHAFVTTFGSNNHMNVIDISDPGNMGIVGTYVDSPSGAFEDRPVIAGDYAFLAHSGGGLRVIDISDVTLPNLIGGYVNANLWDLAIDGDHLFAIHSDSLLVLDVGDPTTPVRLGSVAQPGMTSLAVQGDRVYVSIGLSPKLIVFDVNDPADPTIVDIYYGTLSLTAVIEMAGPHLYVSDATTFRSFQVQQDELELDSDHGQSLQVNVPGPQIVKARLIPTSQGDHYWRLSASGGANWYYGPPSTWFTVPPGTDLRWSVDLVWSGPGVNPSVSELQIDWLYEGAQIDSITDVGNDQGRQARVHWTRSAFDFVGLNEQIHEYALYRRIDSARLDRPQIAPEEAPAGGGGGLPLTGWDFVMTVPATAEDEYSVVAPTLVDSTATEGIQYSAFLVRALTATPGVFFDSLPDSGYSVDNLAPSVPSSLQLATAQLTWDDPTDGDFQRFAVYGSDEEDLGAATLLGYTVSPSFDVSTTPHTWYLVTASDFNGNESPPASVTGQAVSAPSVAGAPAAFFFAGGSPNPFRDGTSLAFGLPRAAITRILIYDVQGRLVKTLLDEELAPGAYRPRWSGRNDTGASVSPGIYFVRMEAGDFRATKKVIRLR